MNKEKFIEELESKISEVIEMALEYGTGGRRMSVMSKVVAWMPLPELYTGE